MTQSRYRGRAWRKRRPRQPAVYAVVALHLECPACKLETERRRLGPDAVGPADDRRVAIFEGFRLDDLEQRGNPTQQQVGGLSQKHTVGRIDHIGRSEPKVDPLAPDVDRFREEVDECSNIVVGDRLPFLPRVNGYFGCGPQGCGRLDRANSEVGPRLNDEGLNLLPHCELVRIVPDCGHLWE